MLKGCVLSVISTESNMKFHENPSSGSRVFPCGDGRTDGRTDMTKLIAAFRQFCERA